MASQRPESGDFEVNDLASTARLPVLDVALEDLLTEGEPPPPPRTPPPPEAFASGDTHPCIPVLRAPAGLDAADAPGVDRAAELLREMQEVRAEAEARYRRLESDLDAARRLGEDLDAMRRDAEARATEAEQRSAMLDAELSAALQGWRSELATLERQHDAERAALRGQLDELHALKTLDEAALADAREEVSALGRSLDDSRAALAAAERDAQLGSGGQAREIEQLRAGMAELTALAAAQVEALQAVESRRGIWASLLGAAESRHDEQLREAQRDAEAQAAALRASLLLAEDALAAARGDAEARAIRLAALEAERDGLQQRESLLEERVAAATAQAEEYLARSAGFEQRLQALQQSESQQALQGELRRSAERVGELESDLHAAEDQINRLEGELRVKSGRLEDLSRAGGPAAASAAEPPSIGGRHRDESASRSRDPAEVGTGGEPVLPADSAFSGAGAAASADGVTRYFVLMDGDTEIVHVLGRRTTIGRGLDNDVRIDTKFVSRHHAVVLAGPSQTVIEDLRSTNGVLVNGRRVTRSALRDGDIVHVGKSQFRFVQRSRER